MNLECGLIVSRTLTLETEVSMDNSAWYHTKHCWCTLSMSRNASTTLPVCIYNVRHGISQKLPSNSFNLSRVLFLS